MGVRVFFSIFSCHSSEYNLFVIRATSTDILKAEMTSDQNFDKTLQKERLENLTTWVSEFSKDLRGIRYPSQ